MDPAIAIGIGPDVRTALHFPGFFNTVRFRQTPAVQVVSGFTQPCHRAGHHSRTRSCSQPGSSFQFAAVQVDLARCQVRGAAPGPLAATSGVVTGAGVSRVVVGNRLHPIRLPTIRAGRAHLNFENGRTIMWLIVLEAAAALAVLVGLVWWTMFSGRRQGELPEDERDLDR